MKKVICLCLLMLLLPACKTQKHIEVEKVTAVNNKISTDENVNRNTIRYITIVEYRDKKDSISGEYPIEKVTNIKETNNDEIQRTIKEDTKIDETINLKEDIKPVNTWKWYVICYISGIVTVIIIWLIVKLIKWYIKIRTGV